MPTGLPIVARKCEAGVPRVASSNVAFFPDSFIVSVGQEIRHVGRVPPNLDRCPGTSSLS
jgi:hypothetical protein